MSRKKRNDYRIQVLLDGEQRQSLDEEAMIAGMPTSTLMRTICLEEVERRRRARTTKKVG